MNKHTSLRSSGSLLERAAEIFDFRDNLRGPTLPAREPQGGAVREPEAPEVQPEPAPAREPVAPASPVTQSRPTIVSHVEVSFPASDASPQPADTEPDDFMQSPPVQPRPTSRPSSSRRSQTVDRTGLRDGGFILPDAPVTGLAEEFRIIKRQLLDAVAGKTGVPDGKRQTLMVCSAAPDDGKTFCAVNLALSLAVESDVDVLLVDGDFPKPEILSILGLEGGPGLIDAIADPAVDPESLIIQTDVKGLSVLPAGRQANNIPELLASARADAVLRMLAQNRPGRVIVFDSPPALMASHASVLASKVGQVVVVVRADRTSEADLREAVGLLSGCEHISLMLNGAGFAANGRRFGSYYGYGQ